MVKNGPCFFRPVGGNPVNENQTILTERVVFDVFGPFRKAQLVMKINQSTARIAPTGAGAKTFQPRSAAHRKVRCHRSAFWSAALVESAWPVVWVAALD